MGRTRGQRIEELRGGAGETDRHWNRQMEPGPPVQGTVLTPALWPQEDAGRRSELCCGVLVLRRPTWDAATTKGGRDWGR